MTSLSFAEKTRIGAILRRVMLNGADQADVQMAQNTEHSSFANQAQAPLGMGSLPNPGLRQFRRPLD